MIIEHFLSHPFPLSFLILSVWNSNGKCDLSRIPSWSFLFSQFLRLWQSWRQSLRAHNTTHGFFITRESYLCQSFAKNTNIIQTVIKLQRHCIVLLVKFPWVYDIYQYDSDAYTRRLTKASLQASVDCRSGFSGLQIGNAWIQLIQVHLTYIWFTHTKSDPFTIFIYIYPYQRIQNPTMLLRNL